MDNNQKYLPTYWVHHRPGEDDVFIESASKSLFESEDKMKEILGEEQFLEEIGETLFSTMIQIKIIKS